LAEGFFPPPVPLRRTEDGLKTPDTSEVENKDEFPSLFVSQATNLKIQGKDLPQNLPYVLYCPTVLPVLKGTYSLKNYYCLEIFLLTNELFFKF